MLRSMLCVAVALFFCADVAMAKGKGNKGPQPAIGTIKSVDKDKAVVTVTVTKKKATEDKDFTIPDGTPITITNADGTTKDAASVKEGLKDAAMVAGASIKVTTGADGTVTKVEVGGAYTAHKKKKNK